MKKLFLILGVIWAVAVSAGLGFVLLKKSDIKLGVSNLFPQQGGTGIGTATTSNIGQVLTVSSSNPFTFKFATPAAGSGSGSGIVSTGTAGEFPYYDSTTTTLTATSSLFITPTRRIGINSSSPIDTLGVQGGLQVVGGVTSTNLSVVRIGPASDSDTLTIGAPQGTGLITVGNSTVAQTLSLGIGTSSTINLGTGVGTTSIFMGTGGAAGGVQIGGTNVSTTIVGGLTIVGNGATSTNLSVSGISNLSGRVSIGTTSPQAKLIIQGDGLANPFQIVSSTAAGTNIFSVSQLGAAVVQLSLQAPTILNSSLTFQLGALGLTLTNAASSISWSGTGATNGTTDTFIGRDLQAGSLQMGVDALAPVAQLFKGADARIGTDASTTGGIMEFGGGRSTGAAPGGPLYLSVTPPGTGGTASNTYSRVLTINGWGMVGINSTTPSSTLTIVGVSTNNILDIASSSGASFLRVLTNGRVGVNSSSPQSQFSVQGEVRFMGLETLITGNGVCITTTGTITNAGAAACIPSALVYKTKNTVYKASAVELFQKLVLAGAVQNYELKSKPNDPRKGLIADFVEKVDKDLVGYTSDGKVNTLHFEDLTGLAVKAIAELAEKNIALEKRISKLEKTGVAPANDTLVYLLVTGSLLASLFAWRKK